MDDGYLNLVEDMKAIGEDNRLEGSGKTILVNQQCVMRESGLNWLDVADNYDGTGYDQHNTLGKETDPELIKAGYEYKKDGKGMVYRPEQMLWKLNNDMTQVPSGEIIICADTPQNMAVYTRYGYEHYLWFYNDFQKFQETMTHTTGGHPIVKSRNQ